MSFVLQSDRFCRKLMIQKYELMNYTVRTYLFTVEDSEIGSKGECIQRIDRVSGEKWLMSPSKMTLRFSITLVVSKFSNRED